MTKSQSFIDKSYYSHENHFNDCIDGGSRSEQAKTWLQDDTVDAWRHERLRQVLIPLINYFPQSKWLTVGDGRYGTDAQFLKKNGLYAVATDISDVLLKEGKALGFIDDFAKENAEQLSFVDNQFDFVYCKEAYHHFPRPMIALYEMIRVAKTGVILSEPKDALIFSSFLTLFFFKLKSLIKILISRQKTSTHHDFESSGNYVYTLSEREMEKVALGVNFQYVAFKLMQDFYLDGVEYEKATRDNKVFQKLKSRIALLEFLDKLGISNTGVLTAMIFKISPSNELQSQLKLAGFKIVHLPKNPYL